jgi:hypothetical protein
MKQRIDALPPVAVHVKKAGRAHSTQRVTRAYTIRDFVNTVDDIPQIAVVDKDYPRLKEC